MKQQTIRTALCLGAIGALFWNALQAVARPNFQGVASGNYASSVIKQSKTSTSTSMDGQVWEGENRSDSDKCGFVYDLGEGQFELRPDVWQELIFEEIDKNAVKHTRITFSFKPESNRNEIYRVSYPLSQLKYADAAPLKVIKFRVRDIYKKTDGVPDLRRIVLIMTGQAKARFASLHLDCVAAAPETPTVNSESADGQTFYK